MLLSSCIPNLLFFAHTHTYKHTDLSIYHLYFYISIYLYIYIPIQRYIYMSITLYIYRFIDIQTYLHICVTETQNVGVWMRSLEIIAVLNISTQGKEDHRDTEDSLIPASLHLPLGLLYAWMRSPLTHLFSRLNGPSSLSLSS